MRLSATRRYLKKYHPLQIDQGKHSSAKFWGKAGGFHLKYVEQIYVFIVTHNIK